MTEGGIVAWKLKPGDEFSSGDVLFEVETDKATMDVEAMDDGIMFEILEQEGTSGVPVGKLIALLAEPGDDLNTLTKPDLRAAEEAPKSAAKEEPKEEKQPAPKPEQAKPKASKSPKSVAGKANPNKTLTPAVQFILHANGISDDEAYARISASGPQGRILKGDVLAHLGKIAASATSKIAAYVKSKESLDLSNIKIVAAQPAAEAKPAEPASVKPSNIVSMELVLDSEDTFCKQTFKQAFKKAVEDAKRVAFSARFPNYALSPVSSSLYEEDIFDDLLVAPVSKERLLVVKVDYKFDKKISEAAFDAFGELLGKASAPAPQVSPNTSLVVVTVEVKYDDKLSDSKDFLLDFQDSLREQFPWKQVMIHQ